ncbi:site-specific DNA-methyltransferase [Thiorhodococcus mannitoliphagus]|uniref:site-specific DNA-methyltransferase (adenine-specific) n=1 Tax=Thiorhodococcus mannitoliphagus TaxID=329406 RepID=A0A6P1DV25_9GAMM|nr:site-specific DNA-methyltransferase [Thiorhodococcus mannitoliphagus]NEX19902.1 site-specific DNA-methyltransferase [Thiorhodococcus mannitoliphagus]
MSEAYKKLIKTLRTLFEMDKADLDFGIYRILNQKRDEIERFLENDLLPQVKAAFADYATSGTSELQTKLDDAIEQATQFGAPNPEQTPAVLAIKAQLANAIDLTAVENEIYSHLYTFFSRYYDQGDFISQRRYKSDTYAIPYEGEEVKLYWANHDQYYVKSSEHLRDYAFTAHGKDGKTVRIKLIEADTEKDNVKAKKDEERRFVLDAEQPLALDSDELQVRFHYIPVGKKKQDALNAEAVKTIFAQKGFDAWLDLLRTPAPTEANPKRTLLEKHLSDYTARNTFDYFIHKDLGGFLRRELDFYVKNEVMYLDDIDDASFDVTQAHLRKIKVLRAIAHKLIRMLAQMEDFQKTLWLKKKFVVETNYLVTMDLVPNQFWSEILENKKQLAEWKHLFGISDLSTQSPSEAQAFLEAHPTIAIDTSHFSSFFRDQLISAIEDFESSLTGILLRSDNFHALGLLVDYLQKQVKCIYIDPPYNTSASAILYKNDYKHSSWCTMMRDRLSIAKHTLKLDGAIFVSIDKTERTVLEHSLDAVFGEDNHIEELIWTQATANGQLPNYSTNHEYVEVYARSRTHVERDAEMFREPKPGYAEMMDLIMRIGKDYPPVDKIQVEIKNLFNEHIIEYKNELELEGKNFDDEAKRQDPWRGIYPYNKAEYRDSNGAFVDESIAREANAEIWVWSEISAAAPASKQSPTTKDPNHFNFRYYKPPHPVTGKVCSCPRSGWKFPYKPDPSKPSRKSFTGLARDDRIAWGNDESKLPRTKGFLHEVETNIGTSVFYEYNDGESEITEMFAESGLFLSPKSSRFVKKFVAQAAKKDDWVMDFFGGSGSSGHAVLQQNREDSGNRKMVLVEMGHHFDDLLVPRMKKAIYSSTWKQGKPNGSGARRQLMKYQRLESYEDTLNNLLIRSRSKAQADLLDDNPALREDYLLGYWLDVETAESPSLLNVDQFENPFDYKLNIATGSVGAFKSTRVDLVETFNYLLGLRVKHIDTIRGFKIVTGTNPQDESVLVIWRTLAEHDNTTLEAFMEKSKYHPRDTEFDHVYVNGDHTLEDPHSKVKMTEIEFKRLMFDVRDL